MPFSGHRGPCSASSRLPSSRATPFSSAPRRLDSSGGSRAGGGRARRPRVSRAGSRGCGRVRLASRLSTSGRCFSFVLSWGGLFFSLLFWPSFYVGERGGGGGAADSREILVLTFFQGPRHEGQLAMNHPSTPLTETTRTESHKETFAYHSGDELTAMLTTGTVGARHRRHLRPRTPRREALPDTELRPHLHRHHLDPVVLRHQAQELPVGPPLPLLPLTSHSHATE